MIQEQKAADDLRKAITDLNNALFESAKLFLDVDIQMDKSGPIVVYKVLISKRVNF